MPSASVSQRETGVLPEHPYPREHHRRWCLRKKYCAHACWCVGLTARTVHAVRSAPCVWTELSYIQYHTARFCRGETILVPLRWNTVAKSPSFPDAERVGSLPSRRPPVTLCFLVPALRVVSVINRSDRGVDFLRPGLGRRQRQIWCKFIISCPVGAVIKIVAQLNIDVE